MFHFFLGQPGSSPLSNFTRGAAKFFLLLGLFFILLGIFVIVFPEVLAIFVAAILFLLAVVCLSLAWRIFRHSRPFSRSYHGEVIDPER